MFKRRRNAVLTCFMSGWLKKTFKYAGINTANRLE